MAPDGHADGGHRSDGGDDDHANDEHHDQAEDEARASPTELDDLARRLRERGEPFVRATVVRREPPVSATVGDRAIVRADGELAGWVGGANCAQSTVVREAREVLAEREPRLIGLAPDPEEVDRPGLSAFPMTCHSGGTLEVFLEPIATAERLVVAGDSPIARALAALAADLSFEVVRLASDGDGDADGEATVIDTVDPDAVTDTVAGASYAVVASMGSHDARAVAAALRLGAEHVGLVASERRAESVAERAAELLGVDVETVRERIASPAGIEIGAETPEEIAVSILAELIEHRNAEGTGPAPVPPADAGDAAATDPGTATDPVCGMDVSVEDPGATVEYGGETYYFCAEGCAEAFDSNPGEYLE